MASGLSNEREEQIIGSLTERFKPHASLHIGKNESKDTRSVSLDIGKGKGTGKGNLYAKDESKGALAREMMRARYGNFGPQYLKPGITILRLDGPFCSTSDLGYDWDNAVLNGHIYKFPPIEGWKGKPGPYPIELRAKEVELISEVCGPISDEAPTFIAIRKYGAKRFPRYWTVELPNEQEALRLGEMLEPDIIEEIPEFKRRKETQERWRKYRKKPDNGGSTPSESSSEG